MTPNRNCRVIPVIDVKNGIVVRAVGGRRNEYQPLVSKLTNSTDPVEVAKTLIERFERRDIYVADLDAIGGLPTNANLYQRLSGLGCEVWIDAGIHDAIDAKQVSAAGLICGLETLKGPTAMREIVDAVGSKAIFSLDLKAGEMLGDWTTWGVSGPRDIWEVIRQVVDAGVQRMIVLDLAQVGEGRGLGTIELCRDMRSRFPEIELFAGGGVRDESDLLKLADAGVAGALVASALHNGRISTER